MFLEMDLSEDLIALYNKQIMGFVGERIGIRGYIDLKARPETKWDNKEMHVRYLLIEADTSYNMLIKRQGLNVFGVIVFMPYLALKFPSEKGTISFIHAYQKTTRECYTVGLKLMPYVPSRKARRS